MSTSNNDHIDSSGLSAGEFVKGKPCLCFRPDDAVCGIIETMRENHSYAVAIVEQGKLVGLLTGQDILIKAVPWGAQNAPTMENIAKAFNVMKAGDVMIYNPVTIADEMPIDEAMRIMIDNGFRYLPVIKGDAPAGILNIIDVMRYMEEKARRDSAAKDEILSYVMSPENYGCVSGN